MTSVYITNTNNDVANTPTYRECDICGEHTIKEYGYGYPAPFAICDKCKAAIMAMRDFIYPPKGEEK